MKRDDPYATLGLTWGATVSDIKDAYKSLARKLHPDINKDDSPQKAMEKFQRVQLAYQKLMNEKGGKIHRDDLAEEWAFQTWRNGDIIAQRRTDVAGVVRKRPVKPADSEQKQWGVASLGHPNGRGNQYIRSEYIGAGNNTTVGRKNGTVGSGRSKWVQPKEFKPWDPKSSNFKKFTGDEDEGQEK